MPQSFHSLLPSLLRSTLSYSPQRGRISVLQKRRLHEQRFQQGLRIAASSRFLRLPVNLLEDFRCLPLFGLQHFFRGRRRQLFQPCRGFRYFRDLCGLRQRCLLSIRVQADSQNECPQQAACPFSLVFELVPQHFSCRGQQSAKYRIRAI